MELPGIGDHSGWRSVGIRCFRCASLRGEIVARKISGDAMLARSTKY
jgi:hypothetical protein